MQLRNLIEKSGQKVGITFLYLSTYRYNRSVTTEWAGGQLLSRILADTLTLFQLGRTHYAHHIIPPIVFSDFPTALYREGKQAGKLAQYLL